jgi:hypothetical protein
MKKSKILTKNMIKNNNNNDDDSKSYSTDLEVMNG